MARTKAHLKKLHRELWQWLADNPNLNKEDWPRWRSNGGKIKKANNYCFACEWVRPGGEGVDEEMCYDCPCFASDPCEGNDENAWDIWRNVFKENQKTRTKYALLVRDAWK